MSESEPKYTLYDSVEQLLAPVTLSGLLSKPVTRVDCLPMNEHRGMAGGRLDYVTTNIGRYVLKRMSRNHDWIMFSTADEHCRAVRLWQYGLLDQLRPHLEHRIFACARDKDGWAILMQDLTGHVYAWDEPMSPKLVLVFLDRMARLHATFWNDPRLNDEHLGLCDTSKLLDQLSRIKAHRHATQTMSLLPAWIVEGWEVMAELLEPDVFKQMSSLAENPLPLIKALTGYPYTLLHGDYRAENLAYPNHPVAFDWQNSARSLMTADLAWFCYHGYVRDTMGQAQAIHYYREQLETYLNQRFDDRAWQAMLDLGFLIDAIRLTWLAAYWYKHADAPKDRLWNEMAVNQRNQQVRDALRWL